MRSSVVFLLVAVVTATRGYAQLSSDQVPHERTLPLSEEVRRQLEVSRYHFGIFRLQPAFAIRDLGYDNNVFGTSADQVADWRSTVSIGLRSIVPMGSKVYLRTDVVPEYTYYRKLTNRRTFGGEYGASLLGLYNRMTVQFAGTTFRGVAPVSSEIERAAFAKRDELNGGLEVDVLRRLALFGTGTVQRQRFGDTADDPDRGISLQALERNERAIRGGVRYRFASYVDFSAAVERTATTFVVDRTKNNKTRAALVGFRYDRPRTFFNASIGKRTGEAEQLGSRFPRFSTVTGSYYAAHELASRLALDVYGHRALGYSATVENPYYLENRYGLGLTVPIGRRMTTRVFGEAGSNDYPIPVKSIKRVDDVKTYGGGFAIRLYRNITFATLASNSKYESTVGAESRSIFRVTTSIGIQRGSFQ